jgi:hypothetical protein
MSMTVRARCKGFTASTLAGKGQIAEQFFLPPRRQGSFYKTFVPWRLGGDEFFTEVNELRG